MIDYVYIDEVQDLTMSQICLLKYVCPNAEHGFIFSGDTAQTIARGVDIRFEDIKTLFYHKFMGESSRTFQKKEKGKMVSDIFLLTQNFRTHDGVLKLYQSVIDLLSHFFPDSIDRLKPETSLIIGEPPIVLQCQKSKDGIEKILGSQGGSFGAQQVILVRDLSVKKDVLEHVESRSLVLTISECKGLEFEDVLLYNFFGSSPFKNQWRVIYGFMKELGMPVPITQKFPSFDPSRHGIMCYELKQLYVAITRTRNRLWILDDKQDSVEPMFDYWRSKELVQLKDLDESFVTKMKVESSSQDWKTRGHELYDQKNYEAATMCFEKAEDFIWVQKSKAAGQINPDEAIKDGDKEGLKMDMQMEEKEVTPKVPGRFEEGSQLWNTLKDLVSIVQASNEQVKRNKKEKEDRELTQASGAAVLPNADTEGEASEATRSGDGGKVLEEGNISKKKSKKGISKGRRKGR
ncbi:uncharacterized protein LOC130721897 [Lotus japonicus]|uniref:uncharacterized protein LOC130721897 n=1 Tax=Lotus japonicus TaxID=34305 RepID=UPI00258A0F9E|nr:uncharacterized protein LOC130721897 [Lotus japonicus]